MLSYQMKIKFTISLIDVSFTNELFRFDMKIKDNWYLTFFLHRRCFFFFHHHF